MPRVTSPPGPGSPWPYADHPGDPPETQPEHPAITTVAVEMSGTTVVTSLPATVNLVLYQGDDFILTLTVSDSDGAPVDLTGAAARAQIRATAPAVEFESFDVSIEDNVVTLHLTAEVSAELPLRAVWDCRLTQDELTTTLAAGTVTLTAGVTR